VSDPVRIERDGPVARVVLDRPDRRNALSRPLARALREALDDLAGSDARVVVLAGAGAGFCAGGDVDRMAERREEGVPVTEAVGEAIRVAGRTVRRVAEHDLPTIAAVDGAAYGAGATLAIACDIQYARPQGKISFGIRRVGLAIDSGVSHLLPRLVGLNTAKELVFTGELIDADRARELGIFTRVFEADSFEAAAENVIEDIASGPTVALTASKRLLNHQSNSFDAATSREASAQEVAFSTADHEEGARAFVEGRQPEFDGR
jgi:enoyl-CoA hydratase/carnithine racemase